MDLHEPIPLEDGMSLSLDLETRLPAVTVPRPHGTLGVIVGSSEEMAAIARAAQLADANGGGSCEVLSAGRPRGAGPRPVRPVTRMRGKQRGTKGLHEADPAARSESV
jgi:hypothetical protein